jgi:hypothetical protein
MPVLHLDLQTPQARRVVIAKPGLYPLAPDLSATRREAHWPGGVWLALLVCHLGDFLTRRASLEASRARCEVRVDGRPLLGDLERLSGKVDVDLSGAGSEDPSLSYRVEYRQLDGPPIDFQMADGNSLRCSYSNRPMHGQRAIRCSGCYRLFSKEAWESELGKKCPACGWSPREVNRESPF